MLREPTARKISNSLLCDGALVGGIPPSVPGYTSQIRSPWPQPFPWPPGWRLTWWDQYNLYLWIVYHTRLGWAIIYTTWKNHICYIPYTYIYIYNHRPLCLAGGCSSNEDPAFHTFPLSAPWCPSQQSWTFQVHVVRYASPRHDPHEPYILRPPGAEKNHDPKVGVVGFFMGPFLQKAWRWLVIFCVGICCCWPLGLKCFFRSDKGIQKTN